MNNKSSCRGTDPCSFLSCECFLQNCPVFWLTQALLYLYPALRFAPVVHGLPGGGYEVRRLEAVPPGWVHSGGVDVWAGTMKKLQTLRTQGRLGAAYENGA